MRFPMFVAAICAALVVAAACGGQEPTPGGLPSPELGPTATPGVRMLQPGDDPQRPEGALDTGKDFIAVFQLTGGAEMRAMLFEDRAPLAVENFVNLARVGFYNGVPFQAMNEEMARGGPAEGDTGAELGYSFEAEFHPELKHDGPGVLSMPSSGGEIADGEFIITLSSASQLDAYGEDGELKDCAQSEPSCHVVFGEVTEGMDALEQLSGDEAGGGSGSGYTIQTIEVIERFEAEPE